MPDEEREALVEALSDSLNQVDVVLSPQWKREVENRIAQIERGEVQTVPWNEVEARIKKSLESESRLK